MSSVLNVRNLKISFRTNGGTVKAVRDISFDLEKGKIQYCYKHYRLS